MGSLVFDYNFYLTRSKPDWYLVPGALFLDTFVGLPALTVSEIPYQLWKPVIKPCLTVIANLLNLIPREFIELAGKTTIFLIPIASAATILYVGSITFGSRSLSSDAIFIKDSLFSVCKKAVECTSPMVVLALASGVALGAALSGEGKGGV